MKVKYYPKIDDSYVMIDGKLQRQWKEVPGQTVSVAIGYPDDYDPNKKYPVVFFVHGIGERGAGTLSMLENFIQGFDYNNDGKREGTPFLTPDAQKAVDQYKFIAVVPNYSNFYEPNLVNWTFDFVRSLYSTVDEFMFVGFSYGGGAVLKYVTSTLASANRVAVAVPCAPTDNTSTDAIVGNSNLPLHIFVNERDDNAPTNMSVTRSIVNQLNISNPTLKIQYTAFDKNGHGGYGEAVTIAPPVAPNGEGVINISENIYQWYLDVLKNGPRQIKTGTVVTPPVDPPPSKNLTIDAGIVVNGKKEYITEYTTSSDTLSFDGSLSTGWTGASWGVTKVPTGVSIWENIFITGGGWVTSTAKFPKEGVYNIQFKVGNGTEEKTMNFVITYSKSGTPPPPEKILLQKVFIQKNNNYVYVYDDGTTETKNS